MPVETNAHLDFSAGVVGVEFRRSPRYRILQRCQVRLPGASAPEAWRSIAFSISQTGIGVTMPCELQKGDELTVVAWNLPKARPLQARVVHASRLDFVWLCGCELTEQIGADDLADWLVTATAGLYSNE